MRSTRWILVGLTAALGLVPEARAELTARQLIHPRIDVFAQYALRRLSLGTAAERRDASEIFAAVRSGTLAGIYKEDEGVPARLARKQGRYWWQLVPAGRDAAAIADPRGAPILVFRDRVRSDRSRLDPALRLAWAEVRRIAPPSAPPPQGPPPPPAPPAPPSTGPCAELNRLTPRERAECVKPLAEQWARQGLAAIEHLLALAERRSGPGRRTGLVARAFQVHFKGNVFALLATAPGRASLRNDLIRLRKGYRSALEVFRQSRTRFRNDERYAICGAKKPPACAIFARNVYFTAGFVHGHEGRRLGRTCLSAMDLHETIHVVDPDSGGKSAHISESQPEYDQQTRAQAVRNPSAYNAFGQHVCYGRDTRFGGGKAVRHIDVPPAPRCLRL